jgi:hypothetical protein
MENSRIAGAKRRLVVAKRLTAAVAAVAFGATFVAIRSGGAATPNTAPTSTTSTTDDGESTPSSQQSFFGNSSVGSSSGAAPSVSTSTS